MISCRAKYTAAARLHKTNGPHQTHRSFRKRVVVQQCGTLPKKRRRNKDIILAGATNKKQRDNRVSYTRYSSSTGAAIGAAADDVYTCDIS